MSVDIFTSLAGQGIGIGPEIRPSPRHLFGPALNLADGNIALTEDFRFDELESIRGDAMPDEENSLLPLTRSLGKLQSRPNRPVLPELESDSYSAPGQKGTDSAAQPSGPSSPVQMKATPEGATSTVAISETQPPKASQKADDRASNSLLTNDPFPAIVDEGDSKVPVSGDGSSIPAGVNPPPPIQRLADPMAATSQESTSDSGAAEVPIVDDGGESKTKRSGKLPEGDASEASGAATVFVGMEASIVPESWDEASSEMSVSLGRQESAPADVPPVPNEAEPTDDGLEEIFESSSSPDSDPMVGNQARSAATDEEAKAPVQRVANPATTAQTPESEASVSGSAQHPDSTEGLSLTREGADIAGAATIEESENLTGFQSELAKESGQPSSASIAIQSAASSEIDTLSPTTETPSSSVTDLPVHSTGAKDPSSLGDSSAKSDASTSSHGRERSGKRENPALPPLDKTGQLKKDSVQGGEQKPGNSRTSVFPAVKSFIQRVLSSRPRESSQHLKEAGHSAKVPESIRRDSIDQSVSTTSASSLDREVLAAEQTGDPLHSAIRPVEQMDEFSSLTQETAATGDQGLEAATMKPVSPLAQSESTPLVQRQPILGSQRHQEEESSETDHQHDAAVENPPGVTVSVDQYQDASTPAHPQAVTSHDEVAQAVQEARSLSDETAEESPAESLSPPLQPVTDLPVQRQAEGALQHDAEPEVQKLQSLSEMAAEESPAESVSPLPQPETDLPVQRREEGVLQHDVESVVQEARSLSEETAEESPTESVSSPPQPETVLPIQREAEGASQGAVEPVVQEPRSLSEETAEEFPAETVVPPRAARDRFACPM